MGTDEAGGPSHQDEFTTIVNVQILSSRYIYITYMFEAMVIVLYLSKMNVEKEKKTYRQISPQYIRLNGEPGRRLLRDLDPDLPDRLIHVTICIDLSLADIHYELP
jgi:hypothetical protein